MVYRRSAARSRQREWLPEPYGSDWTRVVLLMVGTQVDDDQLNTVSCAGENPRWRLGRKKPKSPAIIDETTMSKTREKQGFGNIAIWFNHQSFCRVRP
jgi:hypothetical protein